MNTLTKDILNAVEDARINPGTKYTIKDGKTRLGGYGVMVDTSNDTLCP